jgi:Alternative complex III, ActD subunit
MNGTAVYGLMAQFDRASDLVTAAERVRAEGYRKVDAYTPFPVQGLGEALGLHETMLPMLVLLGAIAGCAGGYFMQYYASVIDYPIHVAGRPLHSWPAFVPVTFELTILAAALTAVLGMLALNRLPMPYHPVFNVPSFSLASRDRFFLLIEATDDKFDRVLTRRFLESLGPREVSDVAERSDTSSEMGK